MPTITIEDHDIVAILRLNNGRTNAISGQLVHDMGKALAAIKKEYRALVLAGGDKFFSIGLDLPDLLQLDREEMTDFWSAFSQLAFDLFTLQIPTVCALSGHAVAGGNVLALTCDYRMAGPDKKQIGLNEIKLGVPVPYLADIILRQIIGDRSATQMIFEGEFMSFADAHQLGLVDEIFSPETVEEQAIQKAALLAEFPEQAFAALKAQRVEDISFKYNENKTFRNEVFLDCWFSEPVQKLLHEAAQKF
ncbi:MAG: enoyl-CoA hydratase/isomerase family protein [Desulfovermiculus sp.]|nr:enoyl-CoA hydratase/isomerase family protein [Desulfovermiculus sp.]